MAFSLELPEYRRTDKVVPLAGESREQSHILRLQVWSTEYGSGAPLDLNPWREWDGARDGESTIVNGARAAPPVHDFPLAVASTCKSS